MESSRELAQMDAGELRDERKQSGQAQSSAQNPDGLAHGAQLERDDACGLGGSDAAGTKRMDLLGHLGQATNNA